MDVQTILDRTFFLLTYRLPGRFEQERTRETFALNLEEALQRTHLDRSVLIDAYMQVEGGMFPLLLADKAIEMGVWS